MPAPSRRAASRPDGVGASLARRVEQVLLAVREAEGRAGALETRRAALVAETALMLGRLEQRPRVDAFLAELQEDHNRKNVGRLEALLNHLLVEVFPEEVAAERTMIRLVLTAEAAGPGLDVLVEHGGERDRMEDAFGDNGGALTNVLSMGLRLVSAVRSRTAPFLLLDEADCWIETGRRVESFYDVLRTSAGQLGVQTLAISHHDLARFSDDVHVVRIEGFPKRGGGARLRNEGAPPAWEEGQKGFRHVRLVNFQGFADARFDLAPGLTAIAGPNNRGKSSVTRAWRAVFYGESRPGLIRHGAPSCTVEVGLDGGRTIRWSRQNKRNPVNLWSLHEADGSIVTEDGVTHETGGTAVPDWVRRVSGIRKVEGLDIHLSHQKTPVFLLGEPATKRASVLSIGREAGHVQTMQKLQRDACRRDRADAARNQAEIVAIDAELVAYEAMRAVAPVLDEASMHAESVARREDEVDVLQAHAAAISAAAEVTARARASDAACASLPTPADLDAVIASTAALVRLCDAAERLEGATAGVGLARARCDAVAGLPDAAPVLLDGDGPALRGSVLIRATEAVALHRRGLAATADLPDGPPVLLDGDGPLATAGRVGALRALASDLGSMLAATEGLPDAAPVIQGTEALVRIGKSLRAASETVAACRGDRDAFEAACAGLPSAAPEVVPTEAHARHASALARTAEATRAARAAAEAADRRAEEAAAELAEVIEACGGECPACGHALSDPAHVLEGHAA